MEPDFSKLSTRPSWRGTRVLKWIALGFFGLSILFFFGGMLAEYVGSYVIHEGANGEYNVALNLSNMMDEFIWGAIGLGFYAAILWFLALIVEKVDQIVWLNATLEDREWIYNQYKKKNKNAKNQ